MKHLFTRIATGMMVLTPLMSVAQDAPLRAESVTNTGIQVVMGDVQDKRGGSFSELELEVKISGAELGSALGVMNPVVTAAIDDTSSNLLKAKDDNDSNYWSFDTNDSKQQSIRKQVELMNPPRKATAFSVMGYVGVLHPQNDPNSVVTVPAILSSVGKAIASPQLQQHGVEIVVMNKAAADKRKQEEAELQKQQQAASLEKGMQQAFQGMFSGMFTSVGENDLMYVIKDPKEQLAYIELLDANGTVIKNGSRQLSKDKAKGTASFTVNYNTPIPTEAQLRVYLITETSLKRVPFRFESIALP